VRIDFSAIREGDGEVVIVVLFVDAGKKLEETGRGERFEGNLKLEPAHLLIPRLQTVRSCLSSLTPGWQGRGSCRYLPGKWSTSRSASCSYYRHLSH
jgi:hypothetical protein